MTIEVTVRPKPSETLRMSANVSPTVVASTLMIQKAAVTSGTLLSIVRTVGMGIELVTGSPEKSWRGRATNRLLRIR